MTAPERRPLISEELVAKAMEYVMTDGDMDGAHENQCIV